MNVHVVLEELAVLNTHEIFEKVNSLEDRKTKKPLLGEIHETLDGHNRSTLIYNLRITEKEIEEYSRDLRPLFDRLRMTFWAFNRVVGKVVMARENIKMKGRYAPKWQEIRVRHNRNHCDEYDIEIIGNFWVKAND